jgi:ATP adenylyltransferase
MTYEQLTEFVERRMRMSHIYQPVMLLTLLQHGGECSETEIA